MKIFKILICLLLCICFVQCDTAERRKSKAEDVLKKHLFETLDNYSTYEKISIEIDTLREYHLSSPVVFNSAKDYLQSFYKGEILDERIQDLKKQFESTKNSAVMDLIYGDGDWYAAGSRIQEAEKELEDANRIRVALDSIITTKKEYLDSAYNAVTLPQKTYWHMTHRFRYSDSDSNPKIYVYHYILDPDINEILLSWDENDTDPYTFEAIEYIRNYGNTRYDR